jgi:hypothetical protein
MLPTYRPNFVLVACTTYEVEQACSNYALFTMGTTILLNNLLHTRNQLLPRMYDVMYIKMMTAPEWFITHITGKWLLPTMYALMCQFTLLNQ